MPTFEVGSVVYSISVNVADFQTQLNAAKSAAERAINDMQARFNSLTVGSSKLAASAEQAGRQAGVSFSKGMNEATAKSVNEAVARSGGKYMTGQTPLVIPKWEMPSVDVQKWAAAQTASLGQVASRYQFLGNQVGLRIGDINRILTDSQRFVQRFDVEHARASNNFTQRLAAEAVATRGWAQNLGNAFNEAYAQFWGLSSMSRQMAMVGQTLMLVGGAVVGGAAAATKSFGDFEFQAIRAGRAMELSTEMADKLNEKLYEQAKLLGMNPTELAKAAYYFASTTGQVVKTEEELNSLLKQQQVILQAAVISNVPYETMIKGVVSALGQFGTIIREQDPAEQLNLITKASAELSQTALKTAAEGSDLIESLKMVGPVAADLGETFETTLAVFGAASDVGIRGTMAGRAVRQFYLQITAPTQEAIEELNKIAKLAGKIDYQELFWPGGKFVGIDKYIQLIAQYTEGWSDLEKAKLKSATSTANEFPLLTALIELQRQYNAAGEEGGKIAAVAADLAENAVAKQRENIKIVWTSTKIALDQIIATWDIFLIKMGKGVGKAVLNDFKYAVDLLTKVGEFFESNPEIASLALRGAEVLIAVGALAFVLGRVLSIFSSAAMMVIATKFLLAGGLMKGASTEMLLAAGMMMKFPKGVTPTTVIPTGPIPPGVPPAAGGIVGVLSKIGIATAILSQALVQVNVREHLQTQVGMEPGMAGAITFPPFFADAIQGAILGSDLAKMLQKNEVEIPGVRGFVEWLNSNNWNPFRQTENSWIKSTSLAVASFMGIDKSAEGAGDSLDNLANALNAGSGLPVSYPGDQYIGSGFPGGPTMGGPSTPSMPEEQWTQLSDASRIYNEGLKKLNGQRIELERTHSNKLVDLAKQRSQIDKNYTQELKDNTSQREDIEQSHNEKLADNASRREEIEQSHNEKISDLGKRRQEIVEGHLNILTGVRTTALRQLEIDRDKELSKLGSDLNKAVSNIKTQYIQTIRGMVSDFNTARAKSLEDFNTSQLGRQTDFNRTTADNEVDQQRNLEDMERNHQERLQGIQDQKNKVEVDPTEQENLDYAKQVARAQEDYERQKKRREEDFQKQQAEAEAEFQQQEKDKSVQFRQSLATEKSRAKEQLTSENERYTESKTNLIASYDERILVQKEKNAEALLEIQDATNKENIEYQKQVDQLTEATNKENIEYQKQVDKLTEANDKITEQYNIKIDALKIANAQEEMAHFKSLLELDQYFKDELKKYQDQQDKINGIKKESLPKAGAGRGRDAIAPEGFPAGVPIITPSISEPISGLPVPGWGVFDQPELEARLTKISDTTDDWLTKIFNPLWENGWNIAGLVVPRQLKDMATSIQTGLDFIAGDSIINDWLDYLLNLWSTKFTGLSLLTDVYLTIIKNTHWGGHLLSVSTLLGGWWNKLTTLDLPGWVGIFLAPSNFPMQLLKISGFWDSMLSGMGNSITNFFKDLPKALGELLSEGGQLFEEFKKVGGAIISAINAGVSEFGATILTSIVNAVKGSPSQPSAGQPSSAYPSNTNGPFIQGGYTYVRGSAAHGYNAIDMAPNQGAGANLYSIAGGTVVEAQGDFPESGIDTLDSSNPEYNYNQGYGNSVVIKLPDGRLVRYAHLQQGSVPGDLLGQQVSAGSYIGQIGSVGRSTGPHLHLEISGDQSIEDFISSVGVGPSGGGGDVLRSVVTAIGTAISNAISSLIAKVVGIGGTSGLGSPELYAGTAKERNTRIRGVRSSEFNQGEAGPPGSPEFVRHPASAEDWEARFWWLEQWKAGTLPADEPGAVSGMRLSQGAQTKGSTQNMIRQILDRYDMDFIKKIGVRIGFHEFHKGNPIDALNRLTPGQLDQLAEALNYYEQQDDKAYKTNLQHYISTMGGAWGTKDVQDAMAASGVTDLEKASTSQLENVVETVQMNREAEKDIPEGAPEFVKNPRTKADYVRRYYWLRRWYKANEALKAGQDVSPIDAANQGTGLEPKWEASSADTGTTAQGGGGGILSAEGLATALATLTTSLNNLITSIDLLRPDISAIRAALSGTTTTVKTETTETKRIELFGTIKIDSPNNPQIKSEDVSTQLFNGLQSLFQSL